MKHLEGPEKVKQDIAIEAPCKQEYKFVGSIDLPKGVRLFALNTRTWKLDEVCVKKEVMMSIQTQKELEIRKAIHNQECIYIKAINQSNADRKAARIIKRYLMEAERYVRTVKTP